jgi:hypothetical protein
MNQVGQPITQQPVVMIGLKNKGLAFLLTLLFGPIGMLYATVAGAVWMFIISGVIFVVSIVTGGIGALLFLPAAIVQLIWSVNAVSSHNWKVLNGRYQP